MALAFESIRPGIIKKLKWRSQLANQAQWMTKTPFVRLVSFAVPKNDTKDLSGLRKLRENFVLQNGNTMDSSGYGFNQDYNYANNSYRSDNYDNQNPADPTSVWAYDSEGNRQYAAARKGAPTPGIISLSSTNKGSYGSLRGLNFQIKCFDLAQLETLEVLYMTPGVGVLAEWGWSYKGWTPQFYDDISENAFKDKDLLQENLNRKIKNSFGDYDACIATVTGFNWNVDKDGSYNVQVDAVSRGETMLNMPVNRSNSVLVDYIARLSYDEDVYKRVQTEQEMTEKSDPKVGAEGLTRYNEDRRAEMGKRINLLRVPVWSYDFGQQKLNKAREKLNKSIKEAKKNSDKAKNEIINQKANQKELQKQKHFQALMETLNKYRMQHMQLGGNAVSATPIDLDADGEWDPQSARLNMQNLSIMNSNPKAWADGDSSIKKSTVGGDEIDNAKRNPASGRGIFSIFQNFNNNKARIANVGYFGHAQKDFSAGKKAQAYAWAGYGHYYSWTHGVGSIETDNAKIFDHINNKHRDGKFPDEKKAAIFGWDNNSVNDRKKYRPVFMSQMYYDGAKCPVLGVLDGKVQHTDIFDRRFSSGHFVPQGIGGHPDAKDNYKSSDRIQDSTLGTTEGVWKKGYLGKWGQTGAHPKQTGAKFSDASKAEMVNMFPYRAQNGYGLASGLELGDTKDRIDVKQDAKLWSTPKGDGSIDEDIYLDAQWWNTINNFTELENARENVEALYVKVQDNVSDKGTSKSWDADKSPVQHYMAKLPRVPIVIQSVYYGGSDGFKYKKSGDTHPQSNEYTSPEGLKFYSAHVWYAFVDFQEIDENGDFKFLKELETNRKQMDDDAKAALKELEDYAAGLDDQIKLEEKYLTNLDKSTGEYIPIWALEHILNNTVNFSVKGKRVFRFDSGFLEYKEGIDHMPPPITDPYEKDQILNEYKLLFEYISGGIHNTETPDDPPFTPEGFKIFKKFFKVSEMEGDKQTKEILSTQSWTPIRSLPVKISNHKQLKSTNPMVCLLPGQEDVKPNAAGLATPKGREPGPDNTWNTDEMTVLTYEKKKLDPPNLPDPDLWVGLSPKPPQAADLETALEVHDSGKNAGKLKNPAMLWPNEFKLTSNSDVNISDQYRGGYISNILVHTDVVKKHIALATSDDGSGGASGGEYPKSVYEYYQMILSEVEAACGKWWDLGLQIDGSKDYLCRIVDERYTKNITVTKDTIWKFPLYGKDDDKGNRGGFVIRDFSIQSQIPDSMKALAMYGSNSSFIEQTKQDGNEFTMLNMHENINWSDVSLEGIKYDNDNFFYDAKSNKMVRNLNSGFTNQDNSLMTVDELKASRASRIFETATEVNDKSFNEVLNKEAKALESEDKIPASYQDQRESFYSNLTFVHDNGAGADGGKPARYAEKCLYAMLHHPFPVQNVELERMMEDAIAEGDEPYTQEAFIKKFSKEKVTAENPNYFNTQIPLSCALTFDGISGLQFGNSFALGGLPKRYEDKTAFQITKVNHQIDSNGWQTSIDALMRPIPNNIDPKRQIVSFDSNDVSAINENQAYQTAMNTTVELLYPGLTD